MCGFRLRIDIPYKRLSRELGSHKGVFSSDNQTVGAPEQLIEIFLRDHRKDSGMYGFREIVFAKFQPLIRCRAFRYQDIDFTRVFAERFIKMLKRRLRITENEYREYGLLQPEILQEFTAMLLKGTDEAKADSGILPPNLRPRGIPG